MPAQSPLTTAAPPTKPPPVAAVDLPEPPSPGRGGGVHKYLQSLIKQWGQSMGFKVAIEHDLDNHGRVDVALFRTDVNVACEIASITTVEQEIGNVRKCLGSGFHAVVVVSLDTKFLRKLETAVDAELTGEDRPRVTLCAPEEVVTVLRRFEAQTPETRVAGYRVKVRRANGTDDEARHQAVADVMLKSLKRMRDKKS